MATVELLERTPVGATVDRAGGGGAGIPRDEGGGGGPSFSADPTRFGLWLFLGTLSMLFIGFTSAYIVRRTAADWRPLAAPPILWANTAALLTSSVFLEVGRRLSRERAGNGLLAAAGLLGVAFLGGQVRAWEALAAQGVFLSSHPHSSFFYVLSGVHLVHLLAGLLWFTLVAARLPAKTPRGRARSLGLLATYWHFLAGLWLYVLFLLFVF
jgi:cytochrome c oxidase subunit 3